jgi:predicted nucleic acid-binding protein
VYSVLLDSSVLVPNALCDTLLRLAERGFYRPLWSDRILDEVRVAVERIHPNLDPARIQKRIDAMKSAFEDAMVTGWEATCAGLDLPDPNDRHVLAAAMTGGGQSLVTFNLKDFPEEKLILTGVEAVHPDEFLLDQLDMHPGLALQVLREQSADTKHPPLDLQAVLNLLERCGVPQFVDQVRLLLP